MKEITCKDGKRIRRLSRWIKVQQAYNVTPKHSLYDFCTDENGYHPYQNEFDGTNGTYLDFFRFNGRKYALDDFYRCGSFFITTTWEWIEKDGVHFMSGVEMSGNIFHSLLIECDEYCERLRVYEEI